MRPWASRVASRSSSSTHSPTFCGSSVGTGTCTRCWTTRTGPWLGAWLDCQPLFRHVAEHHFGTRPRDGTGTLVPHHPHSTSCPGSRCAGAGMGFLDVSPCMADSPPPSSGFIVTTICGARCTGCVADLVVRVTPSDDQRGGQGQRRRRRSRAVGLGSEARRESSADARGIRNCLLYTSDAADEE